jgi:hypothetical protein
MLNLSFVLLLFTLIINSTMAKHDVMIITDSHGVGPFGHELFKRIAQNNQSTVIYAHASSAAIHWVDDKSYLLSGGVFHALNLHGQSYHHPNPTDWRQKVVVPKLADLINQYALHSTWQKLPTIPNQATFYIIELGANDYRAVSHENGTINHVGYQSRLNYNKQLISKIKKTGASCLWVGPPDGIKKDSKRQAILYQMLRQAVMHECDFFDSMRYKSTGCDGIHFSCASQSPTARQWANAVFNRFQQLNY